MDTDNSGQIEFDEFIKLLDKINMDHKYQQLRKSALDAFNRYDRDGSGEIDICEIGVVI